VGGEIHSGGYLKPAIQKHRELSLRHSIRRPRRHVFAYPAPVTVKVPDFLQGKEDPLKIFERDSLHPDDHFKLNESTMAVLPYIQHQSGTVTAVS